MIRNILGTSRFLILLAVLGTFISSATLQVFGLIRVAAVITDLLRAGDASSSASKALIADTVAIIDIFLIGTVLFVISAGLYQLFVHQDVPLPGWLKIESLDDLKDNLDRGHHRRAARGFLRSGASSGPAASRSWPTAWRSPP